MANKALLVGINDYPTSPLRGCVNDILDMADLLVQRCGFDEQDVRLLADRRATRAAMVRALETFVSDLRPGDRAVFHFSGHGVQLPELSATGEPDGLDEAVCPVDFTWEDPRSALRDNDFLRIFAGIPQGCTFVWISDSCHSGDISKLFADDVRARRLVPPPDVAWEISRLKKRSARAPLGFRAIGTALRAAVITGCDADETSADALFKVKYSGALTHFLLAALGAQGGLEAKLEDVMTRVRDALRAARFAQNPQLEGDAELHRLAFLTVPGGDLQHAPPPWQEILGQIDTRAQQNAAEERRLIAANSELARGLAKGLGIELAAEPTGEALLVRPRGGTVVRAFWWGFHIQFSRADLQVFLATGGGIAAVTAAIGPVTGPAAPFVALAAGFVAGAMAIIKGVDRGRGVYLSMSWFAPGIFIPTTV